MMGTTDKRTVTGVPKYFFKDENIDRLFAMVMALGAETFAIGEKLDTVVRLLEHGHKVNRATVVDFNAEPEESAQREADLKAFVETILAPFREAATSLASQTTAAD